jgi:uncharacterized membrane protein YtjA (UPF0391 family)
MSALGAARIWFDIMVLAFLVMRLAALRRRPERIAFQRRPS